VLFEEACALIRRAGNPRLYHAVGALGRLRHEQGALDEARATYEEALAALRAVADNRGVAIYVGALAAMCADKGDLEAASERLGEAEPRASTACVRRLRERSCSTSSSAATARTGALYLSARR
jgi:hypothetical protein